MNLEPSSVDLWTVIGNSFGRGGFFLFLLVVCYSVLSREQSDFFILFLKVVYLILVCMQHPYSLCVSLLGANYAGFR